MRRTPSALLSLGAIALLGLGACSDGTPSTPTTPGPSSTAATPATPASSAPGTPPGPAGSATPTKVLPTPHVEIEQTIDQQRAAAIAIREVGGGRATEIEADDEKNVPVWKVTVETTSGLRYRISVDQKTGAILAKESDNS